MKSISSLLTVIVLGAVSVFGCTVCFADTENSSEAAAQTECEQTADASGDESDNGGKSGGETCDNNG